MKPSIIVLTVIIALFWIGVTWAIARDAARTAPTGQKLKRAVMAVSLFLAIFAAWFFLQWVLKIIDPSPPCFTDEQCEELEQLNKQR